MTPFQEIVREKYPFLWWNHEIFNSLKQPIFRNQEKSHTFQKTTIFKNTRKMFKWWLFTIFINIHKFTIQRQIVYLNYFKNTLSKIIVYCTITGSLKTIHSWQISRKLKIQCQNMPLFGGGFHEISGKKHPHIRISRNWL